jgi:hypothetical protein
MTERRYREDEVREIFDLAARGKIAQPTAHPTATGLTLADIQDIGLEVGLEPGVIARAAAAIDQESVKLPQRKSFGMPIEVGRMVHLPRPLTDDEWDHLVAELRSTFKAKGKVTSQGSFKEWRNGNLHAYVEPAEEGYRVRIETLKGNARAVNGIGAVGVAASLVMLVGLNMSGFLQAGFFGPAAIGAAGTGALVFNELRLRAWTAERARQMEHIARRIASIVKKAGDAEGEA